MSINNKINALISLLDDPNDEIYAVSSAELINISEEALPYLRETLHADISELHRSHISEVMDAINLNGIQKGFMEWAENEDIDLLEGCFLIAEYGFPDFNREQVRTNLDIIYTDLCKELTPEMNPKEVIEVFNTVILDHHGYTGNVANYSSTDNSFINRAIETKLGNPIMLSVIYLLMAKRLNIPLIGINSPGHFVIAYIDNTDVMSLNSEKAILDKILFYVDPFNAGAIISTNSFNDMVEKLDVNKEVSLYASNLDVIKRILNNLIYGLSKEGKQENAQNLLQILMQLQ